MAPKVSSNACRFRRERVLHESRHSPKCILSPRSIASTACAACSACSRASSPARPTATTASPVSLHRHFCIWPGLGNGLANLHNARRAHSGIVNIIGEHATYHIEYDAPLTSDIEGVARPMSNWVKTSKSAQTLANDVAEAVAVRHEPPGKIATLIVPADNQ